MKNITEVIHYLIGCEYSKEYRSLEEPIRFLLQWHKWQSVKEKMPQPPRFYWLTDGKDTALGEWSIERMNWQLRYHYNVFKPTHMLPVKLPPIDNL